jgi:hypothetical protein
MTDAARASADGKRAQAKAAKSAWTAGASFPIADKPDDWGAAIAAACGAASTVGAAQALARHGVPVYPVSPDGDKKPLNAHGVYSATTDPKEIDRLWKRHPDALIGVPMGRRTGLFAIDADAKPPHAYDGIGAWQALAAERGTTLTSTRTHLTASGGLHTLYRWPADRPIGCPMKGLPPGVECKGEGGAIVFPPSERGGKPYIVLSDVVPADPPRWLVDMLSPPRPKPDAKPREDAAHLKQREGSGSPYGLKALANGCDKLRNAGPGERDRTIGKTVPALGSLAGGGELDTAYALNELKAAGRDAVGDDSLDDKIKRAFERGMENRRSAPRRGIAGRAGGKAWSASPDGKPRLMIEKHSPEKTVADLRDILASAGGLYDRGKIVKVVADQTKGGAVAHVMTPAALVVATHEVCRPYVVQIKHGTFEEVDAPLPHQFAVMYQDRREWGLPLLNGVASAPLLGDDGSIRTAQGYDAASGMWCENMPDVAELVPRKPDRDDAAKALTVVRDSFRTFPFADAAMICDGDGVMVVDTSRPPGMDESSFLASFMTALCRPSLWLTPGALFGAPPMSGAGVGKGLIVRCICEVAFGRQPFAVTGGGMREEQEKRIAAALIAAGPSLFLDNFNSVTLRSAALASALTERPAQVREFGKLEFIALNALAFVALTGNGLVLAEDLVRRFISTQFDARMEDPEQRRFAVNILAEVTRRRPELLAALLTIWRYGRFAEIEQGKPLGSYEEWCSWVRDPLLALGCRDPVERVSEAKQRDPGRQAIVAVFNVWWERHGDKPVAANELHDDVKHVADPQGRGRQYLAAYLEKLAGTRLSGYFLTRQAPPGKWGAATYALEMTDPYAPYDPYASRHRLPENSEGEKDTE